ncbi:MAG: ribokinase [Dehalococcoidia bacterium]
MLGKSNDSATNNDDDPRPGRIAVVGSCVMDLVVRVKRMPRPAETVFGTDFGMYLGGKGFNQAVAARRAGASVSFIGLLGGDSFGERFLQAFQHEGIEHAGVRIAAREGTGVALPMVDDAGQNSIVVVPRANWALGAAEVVRAAEAIRTADIVMLQFEAATAASVAAAHIAQESGVPVMWNPAPAAEPPSELFELTSILVANELEATGLTGIDVRDQESGLQAALAFRDFGIHTAVVTLGGLGVVAVGEQGALSLPAYHVRVVDSTGAGDAFCGALAAKLAESSPLDEALRFANAAGALAVTKSGAEPSLATRNAIEHLLATGQAES